MNGRRWMLAALGGLALAGCSSSSSPTAGGAPTPTPTPSPVPPAATARYGVTFEALWSTGTHPVDFPADPHFSGLIGATHSAAVGFWQVGDLATDGLKNMAETGSKSPLDAEIAAAIAAGTAEHTLSGGGVEISPGSVSLDFEVSLGHPLVTLVSMVAPSPDWFVGVTALSLRDGTGRWRESLVIELFAYDAGTDDGATFTSADDATNPRAPILRLDGSPLQAGGGAGRPVGRFVFARL